MRQMNVAIVGIVGINGFPILPIVAVVVLLFETWNQILKKQWKSLILKKSFISFVLFFGQAASIDFWEWSKNGEVNKNFRAISP